MSERSGAAAGPQAGLAGSSGATLRETTVCRRAHIAHAQGHADDRQAPDSKKWSRHFLSEGLVGGQARAPER